MVESKRDLPYTREELLRLYDIASSESLKTYLKDADFNDERFQAMISLDRIRYIYFCSLKSLVQSFHVKGYSDFSQEMIDDIRRWRLTIGK